MTCGSVKVNEGPVSGTQIDEGRTDNAWESTEVSKEAKENISSLGIFRNHLETLQTILCKGMED